MPLVDMKDMLHHAHRNRYAVAAFDAMHLGSLKAIVRGCEQAHAPLILSLAEPSFEYFGFDLAMAATERAARRAEIPVAIHLDRGRSLESAVRAVNCGCNGVMVDASHADFASSLALTRRIAEMAHACGVTVEGALGYVAGEDGADAARRSGDVLHTSVEEVCAYVESTAVDCLAVSIGMAQGPLRGPPEHDLDQLAKIDESLRVPLVLHGGNGLRDEQCRWLIEHGVAKINYASALSHSEAGVIRVAAAPDFGTGDIGLSKEVRGTVQAEVERLSHLLGSAGRAEDVLFTARPWRTVEHLIVYNTGGATEAEVDAMMARGREVLSSIPGVRRVATGRAIKEDAQYRCCWIIEFASKQVIDSYRDHPDHVAFADQLFRPIAGDRLSIDYELTERG
jgi:fructose-bisphosphate aldolase class II